MVLGPLVVPEHCVEVEILDDSLPEPWEMLSVQLYTNSTAILLVNTLIDIYIRPNDSKS